MYCLLIENTGKMGTDPMGPVPEFHASLLSLKSQNVKMDAMTTLYLMRYFKILSESTGG